MSAPDLTGIPLAVLQPLADLLGCLCTEVATVQPVCSCTMIPGLEMVFDLCGECEGDKCGQAWLRLARVYPYQTWPDQAIGGNCTLPLAMDVEIGVMRCLPAIGSDGSPPSDADLDLSGMLQVADMWAMYRAIICCGASFKSPIGYEALGPEGGCVGGRWNVLLAVE